MFKVTVWVDPMNMTTALLYTYTQATPEILIYKYIETYAYLWDFFILRTLRVSCVWVKIVLVIFNLLL